MLFDSVSAVKFKLGFMELKTVRMDFMLVLVESDTRRISCVSTVVYTQVFVARGVTCEASMYCKEMSGKVPDEEARIASPCFWIIMLPLLIK